VLPKKALGRGLGELLRERERKLAPGGQPGLGSAAKDNRELGPGLRVLVVQKDLPSSQRGGTRGPGQSGRPPLVKVSLVLGDLAIVATLLVWRSAASERIGVADAAILICLASCGAWLSCLAAWLYTDDL
jgi:hypothetical protein